MEYTMCFFFVDFCHAFEETLNLVDQHSRPLQARLDPIAKARQVLLAPNVSILRLKASGSASKDVEMQGTVGRHVWHTARLNLQCLNKDGMVIGRMFLRGAPNELVAGPYQPTPLGAKLIAAYGTALNENGAYVIFNKEQHLISNVILTTYNHVAKTHLRNKGKPTQAFRLREIFGAERGQKLADDYKARIAQPGA